MTVVEWKIRKLEKVLSDLRSGMMNLQDMKPRPFDWVKRVEAHNTRMMKVENELFELKQGRLL